MKKTIIIYIVALVAVAIAAYFYYAGKEYTITLTESQLQEKLAEKLPLTKTYFFIFQVTLENPRVFLTNGRKRVDVGLDVNLNININKEPKPLGGSIDVSGGVLYVAEKGQFFLTDPVVEKIKVQGIPEHYSDKANIALSKALSNYYAEHPIYTLKSTDIKQAATKLILKDVYIYHKELVIILGI